MKMEADDLPIPDLRVAVLPVTPLQQNCTLVWSDKTKEGAVIDPGGDIKEILAQVKELGIKLVKILITHAHADHAGGTAELQNILNLPIEGPHLDDQYWIDRIEKDGISFGIGITKKFTPNRWLDDGDVVSVGPLRFEVIHCPGHTPGHVIFFNREAMFAQVGDIIFKGSIGRTDFPKGKHEDLIHSIRQKLFPLGDDIVFVPGHGPTSTFGAERINNPYVADRLFNNVD